MSQHWTDFREYRRGRRPGDFPELWTSGGESRVEGAACDHAGRSFLRTEGPASVSQSCLSWTAPNNDTGIANQETFTVFRSITTIAANRELFALRCAPVLTDSYRALFNYSGSTVKIAKRVSNVDTDLGSAAKTLKQYELFKVRFRANSTALKLKVWVDGSTEPVGWDVEVTDSALATGSVGIMQMVASENIEILFFSVGTNGDSAPDETVVSEHMDIWLPELDEEIEVSVRGEYYDSSDDTVKEIWFTDKGRPGKFSDYPSNIIMHPGLVLDGVLYNKLEADVHLGGAAQTDLPALRFINLPYGVGTVGILDSWADFSFHGRPWEVRFGKRWQTKPTPTSDGILSDHRRFELIGCAVAAKEPDVGTEEAILQLASVTNLVQDLMPVFRNVGISTGHKAVTSSGVITVPSNTSYDVTSMAIYIRVKVPVAGVPGTGASLLSARGSSPNRQWIIQIVQASHATLPNRLTFLVDNGTTSIFNVVSNASYNDGKWHSLILGFSDVLNTYYVMVDNMIINQGSLPTTPAIASGANVFLNNAPGVVICDSRIENYASADEARARFSAIREPDSKTISMHRCNDNTGSTATDYATLANHGTLGGVDPTHRVWEPTYLGSSELAGVPMPFSGGVIYHAATMPIDSVREQFRFNDQIPTIGSTVNVRAKGLPLTLTTNYTLPSDGPGVIDIVGAGDQPITFGASVTGTPEDERIHIPRLVKDECINRAALTFKTCDVDSFSALRNLLPFKGGFQYTDTPSIESFVSYLLGMISAHWVLDTSGRVATGCMLRPVAPGPYGNTLSPYTLEFLGYPNKGVSYGYNSVHALKQDTASWGVAAWIKIPFRQVIDLSVGTPASTWFPAGRTIVNCAQESSAAGYYLGIDGRTGLIVFGSPNINNSATTQKFTTSGIVQPDVWTLVMAYQVGTNRFVRDSVNGTVGLNVTTQSASALVDGSLPLRIGGSELGSFYGCIAYVCGFSPMPADPDDLFADLLAAPPTGSETGLRYMVSLGDGSGDAPVDSKASRTGRLDGARWAPRLTMDLQTTVQPTLQPVRRPVPAWRVESRYRLNRSLLSGANVVAGVSASDRIALGQPYLSEFDTNENTHINYLNSRDVKLDTPLLNAADADQIASLVRSRIGIDQKFAEVVNWYRDGARLQLTDEVLIKHDRLGLDEGRYMRVVTITNRLLDLMSDIGVWS